MASIQIRARLHEGFIRWALRVSPPEPAPIVLGRRRVYVLPTRAGLGFVTMLLVMLIGAINYNLSLGHALVFLLAGLGVTAILHTFRNLVGLSLSPGRVAAIFAGDTARFHLILRGGQERPALRLWLPDGTTTTVDLSNGGTEVCLPLKGDQRGWLTLPRVGIETRYPLGLIRAWAYCAPASRCLVFPRPATHPPPLPWGDGESTGAGGRGRGSDDFAGLRGHQPADPPRHVAWKSAARQGIDAPLLTKQFDGSATARIWLDWEALAGLDDETRLSVLARWALDAHTAGLAWGLRLPGRTIDPATGDQHLHATLKALALHGREH
ncbi:MAG: hypothetical protein BWK76_22130 [Desulfobulbaceae bacterium A2]|nr:MAG: hypothetical protein BWK76_22130 [Desulfobulbaceae bacterium A2]